MTGTDPLSFFVEKFVILFFDHINDITNVSKNKYPNNSERRSK